MASALDPAWLLHRRPYRDGGFLVDFLTLSSGRIGAVARGTRRKQRGGSTVGLLQPFSPLLIEMSGKGELKTLRRVEPAGARLHLEGRRVFSGLYINELLSKLLPRFEPTPELFSAYGDLVAQFQHYEALDALRRFEFLLLETLGYGIAFSEDAYGEAIDAAQGYRFDPLQGFLVKHFDDRGEKHNEAVDTFSGTTLLAFQAWKDGAVLTVEHARLLRQIGRQAISHQLAGRSLQSRELMRQFLSGQINSPDQPDGPPAMSEA